MQSLWNNGEPEIAEKAESLLEFVGLYAKRHLMAGDLSFGQQKLLEFAMALMNEPKMMLLDEPTAGINPTLIDTACSFFGMTITISDPRNGNDPDVSE